MQYYLLGGEWHTLQNLLRFRMRLGTRRLPAFRPILMCLSSWCHAGRAKRSNKEYSVSTLLACFYQGGYCAQESPPTKIARDILGDRQLEEEEKGASRNGGMRLTLKTQPQKMKATESRAYEWSNSSINRSHIFDWGVWTGGHLELRVSGIGGRW